MRRDYLPSPLRRGLMAAGVASGAGALLMPQHAYAAPPSTTPLQFPRDHGSHPDQRTEWWYITGHCRAQAGGRERVLGFQLTFFRARIEDTQAMRSRFAARQLLFAHAAVADIDGQRFWHDQRIARAGFDIAQASEEDMAIRLHDWSLRRQNGVLTARLPAKDFTLDLRLQPTQQPLLQGEQGHSRKGPDPRHFSRYYSLPQLALEGSITVAGQRIAVRGDAARGASTGATPAPGAAWYDHEWSDGLMPEAAVGWDWVGMNLHDGSALTAFRMRDKAGGAVWDGGSFRHPALDGGRTPYVFAPGETLFQPLRHWKSPLTQARYPVEWLLRTPADNYIVRALMDHQELDSRGSTGAVYWEGLCDLLDGTRQPVGRGYLEMTGYARPLVL